MITMRVAVAFSGGRDSTAAAILLKNQGHVVETVTLRLGVPEEDERLIASARLAEMIGVPHRVVDARNEFARRVINPFLEAYAAGITPNPCVTCNARIKFEFLVDTALEGGADCFATGHYARLEQKGSHLFLSEPREKKKSQIYFLAMVEPARMQRVCFPLHDVTLDQVRTLTRKLPLAGEKSSQDICFLGKQALETYLRGLIPDAFQPGPIMDARGEEIGSHLGVAAVTIGQRRGLGYAGGKPLYVVAKDASRNAVILGDAGELEKQEILVTSPNFWRPLAVGDAVAVRIRYASPPARAVITRADAALLEARFHVPVQALTPGQLGVFYQKKRVVAAGVIR
ncbi:MAG: tRNA 2-thiouridine(34) synthase MnmA [Candidatus Aminicenantes bacterium]|nr:tRNA 2-thiouridine(34) synthase MnmA [Candidatus Aminicenantes bacterium]